METIVDKTMNMSLKAIGLGVLALVAIAILISSKLI